MAREGTLKVPLRGEGESWVQSRKPGGWAAMTLSGGPCIQAPLRFTWKYRCTNWWTLDKLRTQSDR